MKPLIIFRQGGNNSRIGNTFAWIERARKWCLGHSYEFYFPQAVDLFSPLFGNVEQHFGVPRSLQGTQVDWSSENARRMLTGIVNSVGLSDPGAVEMRTVMAGTLGVIRLGNHDWDSTDMLHEFIASHRLTVVEEPFPFIASQTRNYEVLEIRLSVSRLMVELRERGVFAGLHVRQGDYARWRGGEFYRTNEFYNELISRIAEYSRDHGKGKCVVAHNGEFALDERHTGDVIWPENDLADLPEHLRDLLLLSVPEVVIGPVSTFPKLAGTLAERAGFSRPKYMPFEASDGVDEIMNRLRTYFE